jgi:hypothetical protein
MKPVKPDSFEATAVLDKNISLFLNSISQKYGVRIKTDSNYEKGTIRITIKDVTA